ncbi:hypothetical protein KLP40_02225 [Hymenobacter sp. NST-14]|uniref:STAS/SEC14 domain-containing protein n=1 Tax=Hymenobacter piscis TaxID=2839984 RepID=UPI001C0326DF|nr:STAS/SEC14 domain-containing protein [Hymenobacter piscis]MBT9391968.1 hypothetical protein [Hymenobacter piscis]
MKTLTDTPGLTIIHDTRNHWLHLTWRGAHNEAESKAACLLILQKIRQTGTTKILNDATLDLDGWSELTRWLVQDYFRALAAAGVRALAWVVPHNLSARIDTDRVMARQTHLVADTFTDAEEAYSWLRHA